MKNKIDLGNNHSYSFYSWAPDRELNPQYEGIPDVSKAGLIINHLTSEGRQCSGAVLFEGEIQQKLFPERDKWKVENWNPLTLSPSILCSCGDHGYIREGRWEAV